MTKRRRHGPLQVVNAVALLIATACGSEGFHAAHFPRARQNHGQTQRRIVPNVNYYRPAAHARAVPRLPLRALVPMSAGEIESLVSTGKPTGDQYAAYWGRTKQEQYNTVLESTVVALLGCFFSYCLSFVMGSFVATIFGSLFLFWGILSPEFKAYQRNWEFFSGRPLVDYDDDDVTSSSDDPNRSGLYGALFLGRILDVCVVEDTNDTTQYDLSEFSGYTMEDDDLTKYSGQPYLLRVQCIDRLNRELQVHCRLSERYLHLRPGMAATTLLLSTSKSFDQLAALADFYVIDGEGGCWIGDYPYLNRPEIENLFATDDELWDRLMGEADEDALALSQSPSASRPP
jgi:hypothetical protein